MTLREILDLLRAMAPEETAMAGDPVGLLVGTEDDRPVGKAGVCLDATPEAAQRAADQGVDLVIAHHPLIYHPLKRLDDGPVARAVATLVKGDVALYAMHTNWDRAAGGINDTLASLLEIQDARSFTPDGLPRIGGLASPRPLIDFVRSVETTLSCAGTSSLRVNNVPGSQMVSRVAVCGGAGASYAADALAAGANAFVTSDVRHHEFWEAAARGLALLDAGHDATETPGMRALARLLPTRLAGVEVVWVGGPS